MNIYLLKQSDNNGYDTYDSMVVIASDEKTAREIHPGCGWLGTGDYWANSPENVKVKLLGTANHGELSGIVCSSYNAG